MNTTYVIFIVILVLVIIGGILGMVFAGRKRSERLSTHFGTEYDHTVETIGDEKKAITELEQRQKHVEALNIRPLTNIEREQYLADWTSVQSKFVLIKRYQVARNSEGSRMRCHCRHHRRQIEPLGFFARHRRADDAGRVAHDERHFFRRAMNGGDNQVAFVLAPVIIHDNNHFAALERADGFNDFLLVIRHGFKSVRSGRDGADNGLQWRRLPWPRRSALP